MYSSYSSQGKYGVGIPEPVPPANHTSPYGPAATHGGRRGGGVSPWSTGLCHCMDDPANCLITCVCPCITFGQVADIVDQGTCSCVSSGIAYGLLCFAAMACLYSCFYRSKLRGQYDVEEGPVPDCLIHCCCEPCALCQEYRELKTRGFDMGIGWSANVDRQRRGVMLGPVMGAPAAMGGMTR